MSDLLTLSAEPRDRAGKGASRALRREGRTPCVVYGGGKDPEPIHVLEKDLMKLLMTGHFFNSMVMIDGLGAAVRTLPKDVAFDPVTDRPIHADFLRVSKDTAVEVEVPVVFINEEASPGLKRGGVLNVVRHVVELSCPADSIPEEIEVDVTGADVGDSIHISSVKLPKGVTTTITDRDFTIATIVAPSALKSSDGEADAES